MVSGNTARDQRVCAHQWRARHVTTVPVCVECGTDTTAVMVRQIGLLTAEREELRELVAHLQAEVARLKAARKRASRAHVTSVAS